MNMQKAKTRALYDSLRSKILSNLLPSGTKLPSETELIEQYEVSRYSVRKVLDDLSSEGLIEKHQGKGCFVCQSPDGGSITPNSSRQILLIASRAEHFYFLKSIRGIEKVLQESGYNLTIKLSNYDSQKEAHLLQKALSENYAGLLIFPSESAYLYTNLYLYRYIESNKVPCITLGNKLPCTSLAYVISDDYAGGRIAADYLIQKGHRYFACFMNKEEYSGCMRYAGFMEGLYKNHIPVHNCKIIWFSHTEQDSVFNDTILKSNVLSLAANNVSAFFCFNDVAAVDLYQLLSENGFKIPEDISIIGYDDSYLCETNPVPLTALHQDPELAGITAAQNIINLIEHGICSQSVSLPPFLVERSSVKDLT